MIGNFLNPSPKSIETESISYNVETEILISELLSSINITGNIPEEWDMEYFKLNLLLDGVICITDTTLGILPLQTGFYGENVFLRPTNCIISNPVFKTTLDRKIGIDCALIHCRPYYNGYKNIIQYYAAQLANCDGSIATNMMNTRVSFVMEVQNKADRESAKKIYDMITSGEPAILMRTGTFANIHYLNPKQSYIADMVYDMKNRIHSEYLSLLGISTVKTQKKERVLSAELERENEVNSYNIDHAIKTINEGLEVANGLYGFNLKAEKNNLIAHMKEGDTIGNITESDTERSEMSGSDGTPRGDES